MIEQIKGHGESISASRCPGDQRQGQAEGSLHPFPFFSSCRKDNTNLYHFHATDYGNSALFLGKACLGNGRFWCLQLPFDNTDTVRRAAHFCCATATCLWPPWHRLCMSTWLLLPPLLIKELRLWLLKCKHKKLHAPFLAPQHEAGPRCCAGVLFGNARLELRLALSWSWNMSVCSTPHSYVFHSSHPDELLVLVMF